MSDRIEEMECPSCGASASDRQNNKPESPQGLSDCPFCGSKKCCMCDMGDDVECPSCNSEDSDD
jgi:hypothetical protein